MDNRQHRTSQNLEKVGPIYSSKDEKQRLISEEILNLKYKPQILLNVNRNIQGLDKKKEIGGRNPSTLRLISKTLGISKLGIVTFNTTPNVSRFLVPVFVGLFYYYNIANLTLGTYFKLEKNNYEIEYCYRKLGTTSTHFGEKFSLMA